MNPTFHNEFLHARRNDGLNPLLASKTPERSLILQLGNHCIFIWGPFCGLENGYGEKALCLFYRKNRDRREFLFKLFP